MRVVTVVALTFNGHPILHAVVSRSASSNFWWVLETSLRIARESGLQFYHLAMW